MFSQLRQHASENFEPEILFVSQSVGAPLDDTNLAVQSLDESQRHFVFRSAISADSFPMRLNHLVGSLVWGHCSEGLWGRRVSGVRSLQLTRAAFPSSPRLITADPRNSQRTTLCRSTRFGESIHATPRQNTKRRTHAG